MKKIFIVAATAVALIGTSCSNGAGKLEAPKTQEDSLAIAMGLMNGMQISQGLQMAAMQGQQLDSVQFMKGYEKGLADTSKFSYYIGALQGIQLVKSIKEDSVDIKKVYASFLNYMKNHGKDGIMTDEQAQSIIQRHYEKKQEQENMKHFGKNIEAGQKFISEFKANNPDAKTTASGLVYKVEKEGNGVAPTAQDTVKCKYELYDITGKQIEKNDDVDFPVAGVIKGWTEILQLMKPGEKVEVVIPQELAYGAKGSYSIEPFSTLRFVMELVSVKKAQAPKEEAK